MISLVLLIILAWSFYIGYSRGLILQAYYTFSSLLALIIATGSYKKLADLLYLWVPFANATEGASTYYFEQEYLFDLDKVFYAGLAFLVVYTAVYVLMRIIGIFMHLLDNFSPDNLQMNLLSGGLSVVVTLISLQIGLTILSTIPVAAVQDALHNSFLANAIIQYTPITSSFFKQLWLSNITG
ncbi:CvpA family protein [Streptococcus oriscaviae]|uniref:CvpA family protein n=1 Tax=Streptococcus oriscaviae TaxID=2781599 RepID=A0ABX7YJA9_9STRE|nr:CvpA family protein [Streptococcus oriscaviae]QUE53896.1 CvpA family protein [Streptococcus oriscaviae]